ncbi:hypothetical protein [Paenibacillus ginsengihumi]|uniref:hypothetical protein n=1 Tax=Paenibacillus ginsengihumi TaxID=431596 RepID=UPI00037069E1|nr:hypothetical protein [Paenibacillus ginsengihumi]
MWKSMLSNEYIEIEANAEKRTLKLHMKRFGESAAPVTLELNQSELFELLHTFLTINRAFNKETMYFEERPVGTASPPSA